MYTYPAKYSPKLTISNGISTASKINFKYIIVGPAYIPAPVPSPTGAVSPAYHDPTTGLEISFGTGQTADLPNSTYLKYWLGNFTKTGKLDVTNLFISFLAPIMSVFGFWIFLIIWVLYLFAVWVRTQDVTMPLIIGVISIGLLGIFFPVEALPVIIVMFAICGASLIVKLLKE
jgi:hypothetical protein